MLVYSQHLAYDEGGYFYQTPLFNIKGFIISLEGSMQDALARVRNPALRQGLIFGIILGFVLLAISFFTNGFTITLILCLLAAFLAGMRASRETGRITTGTLAGLWTGLIGIFIPSIISFVLLLFNIDSVRKSAQAAADKQHLHITYTNSLLLEGLLINFIILLAFGVLFGVIGGLVGGQFGRRRAQLPPVEEYKEAMFEPPSTSVAEESPTATEAEELPAASESEEPSSTAVVEEPLSETPSEEPTSPRHQGE
jgi:hypothetical protein